MSKLSFRARALDNNKPMPILLSNEVPDLTEMTSQTRSAPQVPTGMEKEEESEHHLQRAISAQQVYGDAQKLIIPTPEARIESSSAYSRIYGDFGKIPKQLIRVQTLGLDDDIPDYDMDAEDAEWVNRHSKNQPLTYLQFEDMMDKLEKGCGNQVLDLQDAQALLHGTDDVVIAVYDYWLAKRLRLKRPLILSVKTEKRDGSSANDPYVGFRRRTEKMQTRKNRKNDESSYEKMLKLQREISRALTLLKMIQVREKSKKDLMELTVKIFEKRYEVQDWNGVLYNQYVEQHKVQMPAPPPFAIPGHQQGLGPRPPHGLQANQRRRISFEGRTHDNDELWTEAHEKHYNRCHGSHQRNLKKLKAQKRRHSSSFSQHLIARGRLQVGSDAEEVLPHSEQAGGMEEDLDMEGLFLFKRRKNVRYSTPCETQGGWPWEGQPSGSAQQRLPRYQFTCLSMDKRPFVGHARRRVGRGGRIFIDRAFTQRDYPPDFESELKERDYLLERHQAVLVDERLKEPEWTHHVSRPSIDKERYALYNHAREGAERLHMTHRFHPVAVYPSHDQDDDISLEFSLCEKRMTSKFELYTHTSPSETFLTDLSRQESQADMEIKEDAQPPLKLTLEPWKDEALPESIFDDMSNGAIDIRSSLDLPVADTLPEDHSALLGSLGQQDAFNSFPDPFSLNKRGSLLGESLEVKSMIT
eukprot:m.31823 g.31823  ORF g.31823 m.31823 type:complete len:697 (+) comp31552_c0_seq4:148-2238(+)